MPDYAIRPLNDTDREWVKQFIAWQWGTEIIVSHRAVYRAETLPGFVALCEDEIVGLITYHLTNDACEIVTLDSLEVNIGIGTALINAVKQRARQAGCKRLWLITTSDNLTALRFYRKSGFVPATLQRVVLEQSRKLKSGSPLVGDDDIPPHNEIELETRLDEERE